MDPMIAKLIESRKKSIATLQADIAKFDALMANTKVSSVAASLVAVAKVKKQRLVKLQEELAGLEQAAAAQLELPTEAVPPTRRPGGR